MERRCVAMDGRGVAEERVVVRLRSLNGRRKRSFGDHGLLEASHIVGLSFREIIGDCTEH